MTEAKTRSGYAAIIGKPNSGKSTLMNRFLKQNLSVVNRKAQTTRNKILGILTEGNEQIIFLDTPGLLQPKYELDNFMLAELKSSLKEADIVILLIDSSKPGDDDLPELYKSILKYLKDKKVIIALNKSDISKCNIIEKFKEKFGDKISYNEIIEISALTGKNVEELKNIIKSFLPESPFYYDADEITDKPMRFFVSEIIREKILILLEQEIPYSVFIDIREYKEREEGKDFINADIIVERESQKIILLGKGGELIKKIGEFARADIESFTGRPVYLKLFVKVRKDWRKDKKFLKSNF